MIKPKVVTFVGTRPEIIRLSRLIPALDKTTNHILVHTGQNYDHQLNDVFFEDLKLRKPDYFLNADTTSLGSMMGDVLKKAESLLLQEKPDAFVVLGDTNSAIAAVMAKRLKIPVYHLEAGNRSFDQNVPEEVNRKLIDHIADFNLPYNSWSFNNLIAEGIHPRTMIKTGSPMKEILDFYSDDIDRSPILSKLKLEEKEFFLVSMHRQENVDSQERLQSLLASLISVQATWNKPILVSTHPRTKSKLSALLSDAQIPGILFHEPFGFLDYVKLQKSALCVLSDSGTISEEASILGFKAVTIRDSMERPEALEAGQIILAGVQPISIENAIRITLESRTQQAFDPDGYEVNNFSERVVQFIFSTYDKYHFWFGIRNNDQS